MKMKILAPVAALGLMAVASSASAYTINDNYWGYTIGKYNGGSPVHTTDISSCNPNCDVIGPTSTYQIAGMDVAFDSGYMDVKIYTNFRDTSATAIKDKTNYGDLFISTDGWHPDTTAANYANDKASSETWEYIFDTSAGILYGGTPQYQTTDQAYGSTVGSNYRYRIDQLALYGGGGTSHSGDGSSFSVVGTDISNGYLLYHINLASLGDPTNIGLHWGMTCGNDVIEGGVTNTSVPEPGTVALLGLGLIGLGFVRRRRPAESRS